MREHCIATLKSTLEYILEDISDDQLFSMVALVTKEAERVARIRREEVLQRQMDQEQALYRNMKPIAMQQFRGAQQHG